MKRIELINLRKDKQLSQQQVADLVGINRSYYGFIETGFRNPSLNIAFKISNVFETTIRKAFPREYFFNNKCYDSKQVVDWGIVDEVLIDNQHIDS